MLYSTGKSFSKREREREALEGKVKVANNRWGEGTVIIKGEGGEGGDCPTAA